MESNNIKYWVSDLSSKAQLLLKRHCKSQLIKEGYSMDVIRLLIIDIENEKLANLEELVGREMMIELSNM